MNKSIVVSLSLMIVAGSATSGLLISMYSSKSDAQPEITIVAGRYVEPPLKRTDQYPASTAIANQSPAVAQMEGTSVRTFNTSGHIVDEPKVEREARDDDWASASETSIRNSLFNIPGINRGTLLVQCGATVCRAEGSVNASANHEEAFPAIEKIRSESFYEPSSADNYIPKRFMPGDSSSNSFIIEFARLHK